MCIQESFTFFLKIIICCSFYYFNTPAVVAYNSNKGLFLITIVIADETNDKSGKKHENELCEVYIFGALFSC